MVKDPSALILPSMQDYENPKLVLPPSADQANGLMPISRESRECLEAGSLQSASQANGLRQIRRKFGEPCGSRECLEAEHLPEVASQESEETSKVMRSYQMS